MFTFLIPHLSSFAVVRSHLHCVHWRIPADPVPGRALRVLSPDGGQPRGRFDSVTWYDQICVVRGEELGKERYTSERIKSLHSSFVKGKRERE